MELIGDVQEGVINSPGETFTVPALGNTYNAAVEISNVKPGLTLTYHPQNTSYLHNYLIVQTGNTLTKHYVAYLANSADYGILFNAMPNTVTVSFAKNSPVTVKAALLGTNWSTGLQTSAGNFSKAISSTEPMMSEQMTSVKLNDGGTTRRDLTTLWRKGEFTINYGVTQTLTGTGITPTDILQGVRSVKGNIEVSVNESGPVRDYVLNASYLNVEIGFQAAPMSTCYTCYSSTIHVNTVTIPGTGVQRQLIEFESKYVTRSSL